jgi:hypothetical protein
MPTPHVLRVRSDLVQGDSNSSATQTAACIDAETLAAWADGGLTNTDAALVEAHLADCERCTAMLATFARTIPATTSAAESLWTRWHLRWLVPVATAATVAALWVLIPREQPQQTAILDSAPDVTTQAPSSAITGAVPPAQPAETKEQEARSAPTDTFATRGESTTASEELADRRREDTSATRAQPETLNETVTVTPPARERDQADAKAAERQERFVPPVTTTGRAPGAAPATPPAPAAAAAAPPAALGAAESGARPRTSTFARDVSTIVEIRSPDPNVRWRVVGAGQVERSTTGGAQWERATVPEAATLTLGSSPSPSICWLAGRSGAIYLTTDGLRFTRVPFPDRTDFVRIEATDARRATVVTVDGRTMQTDDQGATWIRVSP